MTEYKIEKNIPIPSSIKNKTNDLASIIACMEIGDSIFIKDDAGDRYILPIAKRRFTNWRFKSRKENDGRRLWRVK